MSLRGRLCNNVISLSSIIESFRSACYKIPLISSNINHLIASFWRKERSPQFGPKRVRLRLTSRRPCHPTLRVCRSLRCDLQSARSQQRLTLPFAGEVWQRASHQNCKVINKTLFEKARKERAVRSAEANKKKRFRGRYEIASFRKADLSD